MSSSSDANDLAAAVEKLKLSGNEFFKKGEHEKACAKYTEAIEKDSKNAILWANRAAAYIGLHQYLDAAHDCEKAVEIDPSYAKAWSRLGTASLALESYKYSMNAWQKAIENIPIDNTPSNKILKAQCEEGLRKARAGTTANAPGGSSTPRYMTVDSKAARGLPWVRAKKVAAEKVLDQSSSAFAVLEAYEHFKSGLDAMAACKIKDSPQGPIMMGPPQALEGFSSAVIADERVFHLTDATFPDKVRTQCLFEDQILKGWSQAGGPDFVKKEAVKRLKTSGWDAARPALAITVRVWVFTAYFRAELLGHREAANELFTNALNVLDWGRKEWADVPKTSRGSVFEPTFARGIKRLKMLNMHKAIAGSNADAKWSFTVDDLVKVAQELIDEVNANPAPPEVIEGYPGHYLSFWPNCLGSAYGILGWRQLRLKNYREAAQCYLQSADNYPLDDENHPYMLRMSLDCLCEAQAPLHELLPLCKRIRFSIPRALEIWQVSSVATVLSDFFTEVQKFEFKQIRDLESGAVTMDSVVRLKPVGKPSIGADGKYRAN